MTDVKKERDSNFELYRIVLMLLIVAHHSVVNSDIYWTALGNPQSGRSIFAMLFGMWGKTGINCFVMITGYFVCTSTISLRKYLKLIFEVIFYNVIIYMIFVGFDYVSISKKAFVNLFFPVKNMTDDFIGSFIMFYLFVPFINKLIGSLNSKQHLRLVLLCLLTFPILPQTTIATIRINYVMWFGVVYLVASYIRLYPLSIWHCEDKRFWGLISIAFMLLASISVIVALKYNTKDAYVDPFLLVSDSNAILAVAVSFSTFMFFKNIHIKNSKIINVIASSTFGVLCIHANSNTMRQWLWYDETRMLDLFSNDSFYELKAVGYVFAVFVICVLIDQLRIHFIEEPLFHVLIRS